jgi:hypothetical protein
VLDIVVTVSTQGLVVKTSITAIEEAAATRVGVPLTKKHSVIAPIVRMLAPEQEETAEQNL